MPAGPCAATVAGDGGDVEDVEDEERRGARATAERERDDERQGCEFHRRDSDQSSSSAFAISTSSRSVASSGSQAAAVLVEPGRFLHPLVAFEHHQPVRVFDHRDRRGRVELERRLVASPGRRPCSRPGVRPSSEPTLSITSAWKAPSAMCASACFGASLIVVSSASLTLRAEPLRQRLGDADALAVAAERIGHAVPGVGFLRVLGGARFSARSATSRSSASLVFSLALEVGRVDRLRLVGHRQRAGAPARAASARPRPPSGTRRRGTAARRRAPCRPSAAARRRRHAAAPTSSSASPRRSVYASASCGKAVHLAMVESPAVSASGRCSAPTSACRCSRCAFVEIGQQQAQHVEGAAQQRRAGGSRARARLRGSRTYSKLSQ